MKKVIMLTLLQVIIITLMISIVNAGDPFRVDENMELGENDIYNATHVNSTYFYQDGNLVIDSSSVVNTSSNYSTYSNSSYYWDNLNTPSDLNDKITIQGENISGGTIDFARLPSLTNKVTSHWDNITSKFITAIDNIYIYMSGTTATLNETKLNNTIQSNPKNWTKLQNYPAACPAGTYITQLNDSTTCTAVSKIDNNLNMTGKNITNVNYINPTDNLYFGSFNIHENSMRLNDGTEFIVGTENDARWTWKTSWNEEAIHFKNGKVVFTGNDNVERNYDFNGNPALIITSSNYSDISEWGMFSHNQSTFLIDSGQGGITLKDNTILEENLTVTDTANINNLEATNLEKNLDGTGFNITADHFVGDLTGTADTATTWDGETSQADLNVNNSNSSDYWDNLNSQTDITSVGTLTGYTKSAGFNSTENIILTSGKKLCVDGDTCSSYIYYNGSSMIIKVN